MTVIGNDLLPNVYVDRIELFDDYFEASVYCVDDIVSPKWSVHDLSFSHYRIMTVATTSTRLMNLLKKGFIKMDPNHIIKEDSNANINLLSLKGAEIIDKGNTRHHRIKIKNPYPRQSENLSLYVAMVVDPVPLAGTRFVYNSYIQGPITAEAVLSGGQIVSKTNAWVLPNGTQWIGPVHSHPEMGFMQGATHSDRPHSVVSRQVIANLKLKDRRTSKYLQNSISSGDDPYSEVSHLYNSFNEIGNNTGIFFIDLRQLILKNTKYGKVFLNINFDIFNSISSELKFRLVNIDRHKVKTRFVNNKLTGTRIIETKRVLSSFQGSDGVFVVTGGKSLIRRTVFPFDNTVTSFEFTDRDITHESGGEYKYSATLSFVDPTVLYAKTIIKELDMATKSVKEYFGRIKRKLRKIKNADFKPPESWITSELGMFSSDIRLAPWVMAPGVYAKYKKMFFSMTEKQKEDMERNMTSLLNPRTFSFTSITEFIKELGHLTEMVNSVFNFKTTQISEYDTRSYPKHNSMVSKNLIMKTYEFGQIIEPRENEKFYNFLLPSSQETGLVRRVSTNQFRRRVDIENSKFFLQNANQAAYTGVLDDIQTSRSTFFSPYSVHSRYGNEIPLSKMPQIDPLELNDFFDNVKVKKVKRFKVRSRNLRRIKAFQVGLNVSLEPFRDIVEEEEKFVQSREFLGDESTFNEPQEKDSLQKTKLKISKKTIGNIEKRLLKRKFKSFEKLTLKKPNHIFVDRNISRSPRIRNRPLIPNQIRALNAGFLRKTRPNFKISQISRPLFTEEEMQEIENDLTIAVNYLMLVQVDKLSGFKISPNGTRLMKSPVWNLVTNESMESLSAGSLCRFESAKSPLLNMEIDPRIDLPHAHRYFIISDNPLPRINSRHMPMQLATSVQASLSSQNYDITGTSSEVVNQKPTEESQIFISSGGNISSGGSY